MLTKNNQRLFEIRASSIQGQGAFAIQQISEGTRIIEYTGERISHEEADNRYEDEQSAHAHVLLFTVNKEIVIDGGVGGNEAKYFNHSCEPNCETVIEDDRVFIEALRAVHVGEELTFDYQLVRPDEYDPEWDRLYACYCGARNCRGTMLARA